MADPKEWGPLLWKIIHTTCIHLGNSSHSMLQQDELTYFKAFQRKLYYILPCKVCRDHYKQYMMHIKDVPYDALKVYATNYFYELHNKVNSYNNKALYVKEDLISYNCSKDTYNKNIHELNKLYSKYTNLQYISYDELKDFNRILTILRRLMNF